MEIVGLDIAEKFGFGKDFAWIFCEVCFKAYFESDGEEYGVIDGSCEYDFFIFFKKKMLLFFPAHEESWTCFDDTFFSLPNPVLFGFNFWFHNLKFLESDEIDLVEVQNGVVVKVEFSQSVLDFFIGEVIATLGQ